MSVVAVVGVGAIGGVVAARLCAAGRDDVVLCVRAPFDALVVEGPAGIQRATPRLVTTPDAVQPVPWVLVATKAHQTAGAADWLKVLATPATTVAILQNGVEHEERVAPYANGATLLPVIVNSEGARLDEGLVEEIVTSMVKGPPEVGTSMLTDRRAGQLLEADARNGAVVRIGARHGIATPLNRAMTALLTAIHQEA